MYKKNLLGLLSMLVFGLAVVSCAGVGTSESPLSGKTNLTDGQMLYLYDVTSQKEPVVLDSVAVSAGKYAFASTVQDGVYVLSTDAALFDGGNGGVQVLVSVDAKNPLTLDITKNTQGDLESYQTTFSSGKYAEMHAKYEEARSGFQELTNRLRAELESISGDKSSAALSRADEIFKEYHAASAKVTHDNLEMAHQNPGSHLALFIYSSIMQQAPEDENIDAIAKGLESGWDALANNKVLTKLKTGVEEYVKIRIGNPYLDFTMFTAEDQEAKLSQFVGNHAYVLVEFWASWCGFCRKANPGLVAAYTKWHEKGLEIVGLSVDEDKDAWTKAIEADKLTWPQFYMSRATTPTPASMYKVYGIPANVLIDKAGNIVAKNLSPEELDAKLAELIQ